MKLDRILVHDIDYTVYYKFNTSMLCDSPVPPKSNSIELGSVQELLGVWTVRHKSFYLYNAGLWKKMLHISKLWKSYVDI